MKIKSVTCHHLSAPVARPFTSSRGWLYKTRNTCLVEIETEDGIVGWGECYGPSAVARAFIESQLAGQIIGRDPFDVEVIWEHLYNRIKDYGQTGMAIAAISGIDIALWDIIGKATGKPVHKLIGGAFRTEVQAYATGLYFIDMDRVTEEAVEEAQKFVNEGFRAIKMKIGLGSLQKDIDRVAAVREAIGTDIRLMVDANHCYSVPNAIRIGRRLQEFDIDWFEEPISPEDVDGYVEVTRALDIAVAGGENDFTRFGFRDKIVRKAMDIVQPDVCAAGGLTESKKIAALASAHGVECVPHAWGSAVGLAATIHFLASLPDQPPCLVPQPVLLEFEQEENPFRDFLATEPIVQKAGIVAVPGGPGLGIEVDREIIKKYRVA
ncbi:mandelate racemase/muconate lactonizing enzyme family protein [Paracoccus aerodenitrificans]|uniref:mandelate racemase/muconate lactonizing enzyme family protein n=1 Tax=Paracoccus aerodenitrificans TaxID=3017781 RepID=UPI0022EFE73E|nr:mandelate racemase/muconate lactonizing enzyme family protein [Paracoccus aerodenitrificans]WBU64799.1 mandelate racemase/muconate lactonizing enzyme family protein [Paracoccus aerodenitrificans]